MSETLADIKLPLQRRPDDVVRGLHWSSSRPFVENRRGVLIHRPKSVLMYTARWGETYPIIDYWCGASANGTDKFTFLNAPANGKLVCARCEAEAVRNDLPSSDALVGRHVHIGGVIGVRTCCLEDTE